MLSKSLNAVLFTQSIGQVTVLRGFVSTKRILKAKGLGD